MVINKENFNVEVSVRKMSEGMAVGISPLKVQGDVVEESISDADCLRALIYGIASLIRDMEEANQEHTAPGKLMSHTIESLNNLYVEPEMKSIEDENTQRAILRGDEPSC